MSLLENDDVSASNQLAEDAPLGGMQPAAQDAPEEATAVPARNADIATEPATLRQEHVAAFVTHW